jgi:PHD/YefM family antitoxin component YafN of YafNO toxin-antitoxin module
MLSLKNIQPLTEFKSKTAVILGQLKEQRSPIVLTVNGKAECVVLDAEFIF